MSREIKFRAYHKKRLLMVHFDIKTITKTYYPGYYHTADLDGFDCELDDPNLYTEPMQYTGLKDKNGKEIYEGDILADFDGDGCYLTFGVVSYNTAPKCIYAGQYFLSDEEGFAVDFDEITGEHWHLLEVIGNIYESKELLDE